MLMASSRLQFGTVPDWIAAIGTTLAFFVAFMVFSLDLSERRRRQASQVAIWLERGEDAATLHVRNSSEAPVYNVKAIPYVLNGAYEPLVRVAMGPGEEDDTLKVNVPLNSQIANENLSVEAFLLDSAGRKWKRRRDGKLHRRWRRYKL
jgi:hypothetical protein